NFGSSNAGGSSYTIFTSPPKPSLVLRPRGDFLRTLLDNMSGGRSPPDQTPTVAQNWGGHIFKAKEFAARCCTVDSAAAAGRLRELSRCKPEPERTGDCAHRPDVAWCYRQLRARHAFGQSGVLGQRVDAAVLLQRHQPRLLELTPLRS